MGSDETCREKRTEIPEGVEAQVGEEARERVDGELEGIAGGGHGGGHKPPTMLASNGADDR